MIHYATCKYFLHYTHSVDFINPKAGVYLRPFQTGFIDAMEPGMKIPCAVKKILKHAIHVPFVEINKFKTKTQEMNQCALFA
jgi:hypothetical protein